MTFNQFSTTALFVGIASISALIALLYAFILYHKLKRIKVNHARIEEIASYIHQGAMAFMKRQYRIIIIFSIGIGALLALTEFIPSLRGAEGVGWLGRHACCNQSQFKNHTGSEYRRNAFST